MGTFSWAGQGGAMASCVSLLTALPKGGGAAELVLHDARLRVLPLPAWEMGVTGVEASGSKKFMLDQVRPPAVRASG